MSAASAVAAMAVALAVGPPLRAQELDVDPSADRVVRFVSRSQVDEFEGVTDRIDGYVLLDGQPLSASTRRDATELYLEVDLASIDTGIGLRNRHMRDNYLEVDKYPYASFKGSIGVVQPSADGGGKVTASGTFTIHGVSRERDITCDVSPVGEGYHAECAFGVLLSDHDIEIPRVMFLKLANEIRVEVEFTVSPAGKNAEGKP
jgi:polyisoprenoid-binding protein YceI